jgi:DNA-binding NarL/FixJ family response regulator
MSTASKSHKVLIVEDELFTQKLICEIITNLGHKCEAAASVNEALSQVKAFSPELIITDLDLGPGPTGIDLINKMDKEFPEIKLAVLTAHTSPNLVDIRFKGLPSRVQYIVKADLHASNSFENILKNAFEQKTTNTVSKAKPVDAIYLSNTQAELLKLIAQGLSNQAIADQRGTTLRAVEALINRTYQALKLNENDSMNLRVEAVKLWKSSKIHVK